MQQEFKKEINKAEILVEALGYMQNMKVILLLLSMVEVQ